VGSEFENEEELSAALQQEKVEFRKEERGWVKK
jgi:hypothetical protein